MKCAFATPVGSGVPPARSDWWHAKSRHALLRSRTGLRQSVVAPRRWSVRLVSSASAKRMAVEQTGIPMRPPLGTSCEWGYVEWRAAGASQPSAVLAMVWVMACASQMRYYGVGGGKAIPYMCDVNVHYCIVAQVIFCLMILPNIKLLLTLHSI